MAREPLTQKGFNRAVDQLKLWTAELTSVIESEFPPGTAYDPASWPAGSNWDGPMGVIRKRIGEVIEAFSVLQEALGLPVGERSMRQQLIADRDHAAANPRPTVGSVRSEIVEMMTQLVHDENATPRDRQAAARVILEATYQDGKLQLLADIDEANRSLGRRLDVLERRAAGSNQSEKALIMAKKSTPKPTRSKSAPAPPKQSSSKQKPRHGGGLGYSDAGHHG